MGRIYPYSIHRTVLRTYQQLWYSDQLESRLATSIQVRKRKLYYKWWVWMKSTQSNRPNDTSVKMPSTKKTNQQPATSSEARSHISSMSRLPTVRQARHLVLLFFSCWLGVYIHGQVTFCVHGLRSLDQWFCVSSSDSISACIIVSKSIVDGLIDKQREQVFPKMKAQSPW